MIREAGIIIIAAPIVVMARGNVARFLSGAICIPTIPDNVITRVDEVWYSACEKTRYIHCSS